MLFRSQIKNFNILFYIGFIMVVFFALIIISGIFLAMYYKPDFALAFDSVNGVIVNEAPLGWFWRKIHGVGSTFIFLLLYIHMFSMIYLGFYKGAKAKYYYTGIVLYFCFMVVCFTGYVLPMGQMSYWAVQVISSLLEYIPGAGEDILLWVRGDFAVSDITLVRFYVIHIVLMPLVIILLLLIHADFMKWFANHKFAFDRKGIHVAKIG